VAQVREAVVLVGCDCAGGGVGLVAEFAVIGVLVLAGAVSQQAILDVDGGADVAQSCCATADRNARPRLHHTDAIAVAVVSVVGDQRAIDGDRAQSPGKVMHIVTGLGGAVHGCGRPACERAKTETATFFTI